MRTVKQLTLLLALLLPTAAQAQFTLATNADNTLTITGYTGTNGNVVIPDTIGGLPVSSIGESALSSVILTNVTLANGINSLGLGAFYGCINLAAIEIPNTVTNIGDGAFNSCLSLTNVMIPASVAHIGDYAFFYCNNLTDIIVDSNNLFYSSAEGVLFNKDKTKLMQFPFGKGGSYTIPGTVTILADEAFGIDGHGRPLVVDPGCPGLTNLICPGTLTNLGDHAFSHCGGLASVTLSNGVASLGVETFSWCANLRSLSIPNTVTNVGDLAFYYSGLNNVTIPASVSKLGFGAFAVCYDLTNVTLQEGVADIGEAGFNFCTNLNSIVLPESIISIGDRAFWFCTLLTNVIIPGNVTNLGVHAFSACSSLMNIAVNADNLFYSSRDGVLYNIDQTTLIQFPGGRNGICTIPASVTSIGDHAFGSYDPNYFSISYPLANANLTAIYFEGNAPSLLPSALPDYFPSFNLKCYYLPTATGSRTFSNVPTEPWLPQMNAVEADHIGGFTNQFRFNINWASGQTVVVEASVDLLNWQPVTTNTLASGSANFSDPQWGKYPGRFYRLRSP